jgi:hypothetical protein
MLLCTQRCRFVAFKLFKMFFFVQLQQSVRGPSAAGDAFKMEDLFEETARILVNIVYYWMCLDLGKYCLLLDVLESW